MNKIAKKPIYENCQINSIDGDVLCKCRKVRADWYVNRNLATVVSVDPYIVQLNFKTKGKTRDKFYLEEKLNICVVCGSNKNLNKHHCVPICYRRYFPDNLKSRDMHDVFPLCVDCHDKYERFATDLKKKIGEEHGIPLHGFKVRDTLIGIKKHAFALKNHWEKIPVERRNFLLREISEKLGKKIESLDDIDDSTIKIDNVHQFGEYETHGDGIVRNLKDLNEFIVMWRKHFISTMNPQFLPKYWSIEHGKDQTRIGNGIL